MFPINKKISLLLLTISLTTFSLPLLAEDLRQGLEPLSSSTTNKGSPIIGVTNISQQFPYTLDAGDVIALDIFNVPEYSKEYKVLVDGTLNLPLINRISVAGLTLEEAEYVIREEYLNQDFLRDPIVNVNLTVSRPISVAIVGEIRTPGSYLVPFAKGDSSNQEQSTCI